MTSPGLNRRRFVLAAGAATLSTQSGGAAANAPNAPFDLDDPYGYLAAYAKIRGRLDGEPAAFWYTSHGIAQPEGAPPTLLYAYDGVSFQRVRFRTDRTLDAAFADCSYVLDPDKEYVLTKLELATPQ